VGADYITGAGGLQEINRGGDETGGDGVSVSSFIGCQKTLIVMELRLIIRGVGLEDHLGSLDDSASVPFQQRHCVRRSFIADENGFRM
jgi:hypothetical protein